MGKFVEIAAKELTLQPFSVIDDKWMLVTAGSSEKLNTMTASWGGLGTLWNKSVAFAFVRPTRYTFEFTEKHDYFTLSFFNDEYRKVLGYCGARSGRDVDKVKETGLTPVFDGGAVYFEEARLVIVCKKIYADFLKPECFLDKDIELNYPGRDYHKMYIGEVVKVLEKK